MAGEIKSKVQSNVSKHERALCDFEQKTSSQKRYLPGPSSFPQRILSYSSVKRLHWSRHSPPFEKLMSQLAPYAVHRVLVFRRLLEVWRVEMGVMLLKSCRVHSGAAGVTCDL